MIARERDTSAEIDPTKTDPSAAPFDDGSTVGDGLPGPSPLDPLLRHLNELQMLAGHYIKARADQIATRLRTLLLWTIVAVVCLTTATAFLVTSVVFVLRGIASGLMSLGLLPWAADAITGLVCIGAVALTLAFISYSQQRALRRKRRDDYEHFRARYRAKFGHSLDGTADHGR